jgi:hypothetical protein
MRSIKSCMIFMVLIFSGCANNPSNVLDFKDEYYRHNLSKSDNLHKFKEYLTLNKVKLGAFVDISNTASGALSHVLLDGQVKSMTSIENSSWLKSAMVNLVQSELSGITINSPGINLIYCGDYTNAVIGENGSYAKVEYIYFLSNMTEEQRQIFLKFPMPQDCNIDYLLGDVFYKKKLHVTSNIDNAKITVTFKDNYKTITDNDKLNLVLKDTVAQAMTHLLTDVEMLLALKSYHSKDNYKISVPSKNNNLNVTNPDNHDLDMSRKSNISVGVQKSSAGTIKKNMPKPNSLTGKLE